jgi:hypothetical protein
MKRCLIAALVALSALATISSNAVSQDNSTSYSVGGVSLAMTQPPGTVFNPGDEIGFRLESESDAYVIVFNIDTEGYVNLLYPAKGERPVHVREGGVYMIPDDNSEVLLVEGRTGVEFLFALVVPDKDDIDRRELDFLGKANDLPAEERYRIDGDPFIAANIIAGELVRGISRREGIYLDYNYFYVNERVAYPCYLCGECDGAVQNGCDGYIISSNFDQERPLQYPMRRGYEMIEPAATPMLEDGTGMADAGDSRTFGQYESDDGSVNLNFYPYNSEVYYETRETLTGGTDVNVYLYGDPYYEPWNYGWYYYPTVAVGGWWGPPSFWWGVNWGWWGGYYCSSWYWPRCYTVWDNYACHYGYYDGGVRYRPERYKDKYRDGTLDGGRSPYKEKVNTSGAYQTAMSQAGKRDSRMKVASRSVTGTSRTAKYRTGSTTSHTNTIARGTRAIGKSTRVRNLGNTSGSRAKQSYVQRTRTSYTPRTRKAYGVSSPTGKTRNTGTSIKPRNRTGTRTNKTYRSGKSTPRTRSSNSAYKRGSTPTSRTSGKKSYTRGTSKRSAPKSVAPKRTSSSRSSKSGYKPTTRKKQSSGKSRPAVKSGRSSSRSPARNSGGSRKSSGTRSKSGGKGRR